LVNLINSDVDTPVNIGSDEEVTIGELAVTVRDIVASKTRRPPAGIEYSEAPLDNPVKRKP
jgi:nucleoside-diphosphate-sugar epimerase